MSPVLGPAAAEAVIWHDAECGGYVADLPIWERLAAEYAEPVLELGAGTGRVALHLARRGHLVCALDRDQALLAELRRRASAEDFELDAVAADLTDFELDRGFGLIAAPMQLLQLLDGRDARLAALRAARRHLTPAGAAAFAIVEGAPGDALGETPPGVASPLPDVREVRDWVYSSLPLGARIEDGAIEVMRLRQRVAPDGALTEHVHVDRLAVLDAGIVEAEAEAVGLSPAARLGVPATESHVGSTVVVLEAPG